MTWALRNLIAGDETNRSLVGKYGVGNLASLLPVSAATVAATATTTTTTTIHHAEETIFAALSTIAEVVHKNKGDHNKDIGYFRADKSLIFFLISLILL